MCILYPTYKTESLKCTPQFRLEQFGTKFKGNRINISEVQTSRRTNRGQYTFHCELNYCTSAYTGWFRRKRQCFGRCQYRSLTEKTFICQCVWFWMVSELELFEYKNTNPLWIAINNGKSPTVNLILIQCFNEKFTARKWQICYISQ